MATIPPVYSTLIRDHGTRGWARLIAERKVRRKQLIDDGNASSDHGALRAQLSCGKRLS